MEKWYLQQQKDSKFFKSFILIWEFILHLLSA